GGRELSPAARHQFLPGRTVQTIDRVPLKVNYIGETSDGTPPHLGARGRDECGICAARWASVQRSHDVIDETTRS
ncbi:MAG TPA: hypothetical protein VF506_01710, partial [Streptosporangiaceae bacterium]